MRHALANLRGVLGKEQNETLSLLVEGEMLQLNPQSDCGWTWRISRGWQGKMNWKGREKFKLAV